MRKTEQEYLERLFSEMRGMLTQYARQNLEAPLAAEDVVQEVFAIASLRIDALMESDNPKGWLVNTLKNVIRTARRAAARRAFSLDEDKVLGPGQDGPEYDLSRTADLAWVDLFYDGLIPESDYELIRMIDLRGCSIHEAAQKLSIGDEACKKRIQRARARLKKALEEEAD